MCRARQAHRRASLEKESDAYCATTWTVVTKITRFCFVTAVVDDLGRGSDERNPSLLDFASECGVLGKETITESGLV